MALPKFVDVLTLAAVQGLGLRARLVVEGLFAGLHRSPFKGFSVEFSEYRAYQPGDDPRLVDWRAFARSDRYYVKEFEEETNLRFYLCVDSSASMGYPPDAPFTKFDYAATLAAALAYLALGQRDAVGLATFSAGVREVVPPRSSRQHFRAILDVLEETETSGTTNLYATLATLAERGHRRGLFAIFTDLWDLRGRVLEGLRALRGAKHEIILFHVLDAAEDRFPFREAASFVDMESSEQIDLDSARFRESYVDALTKLKSDYRLELGAHDIEYVPVTTDQPPTEVLISYLGKRRALM